MGYGITFGSFNITPSLFYIPNTFSVGGATLKNTWGAQLQPGFHIPFNNKNFRGLLLYGTAGFASTKTTQSVGAPQSDIVCIPDTRPNGANATPNIYYASVCDQNSRFPAQASQTSSSLKGLVLGVGAKLAFSERIYGVFDFTYILYDKLKENGLALHQTRQINGGTDMVNTNANTRDPIGRYTGTLTRDYSGNSGARIRQSFIFIGAGFRFF